VLCFEVIYLRLMYCQTVCLGFFFFFLLVNPCPMKYFDKKTIYTIFYLVLIFFFFPKNSFQICILPEINTNRAFKFVVISAGHPSKQFISLIFGRILLPLPTMVSFKALLKQHCTVETSPITFKIFRCNT
jgi:hypothetical protein